LLIQKTRIAVVQVCGYGIIFSFLSVFLLDVAAEEVRGLGLAIDTKGFTTTTYGGTPSQDVGLSHSADRGGSDRKVGGSDRRYNVSKKAWNVKSNSGLVFLISFLLSSLFFLFFRYVRWLAVIYMSLCVHFPEKKNLLFFVEKNWS